MKIDSMSQLATRPSALNRSDNVCVCVGGGVERERERERENAGSCGACITQGSEAEHWREELSREFRINTRHSKILTETSSFDNVRETHVWLVCPPSWAGPHPVSSDDQQAVLQPRGWSQDGSPWTRKPNVCSTDAIETQYLRGLLVRNSLPNVKQTYYYDNLPELGFANMSCTVPPPSPQHLLTPHPPSNLVTTEDRQPDWLPATAVSVLHTHHGVAANSLQSWRPVLALDCRRLSAALRAWTVTAPKPLPRWPSG